MKLSPPIAFFIDFILFLMLVLLSSTKLILHSRYLKIDIKDIKLSSFLIANYCVSDILFHASRSVNDVLVRLSLLLCIDSAINNL